MPGTGDPAAPAHVPVLLERCIALLAPALTRRLIEDFVSRPLPGAAPSGSLAELTEREQIVLLARARAAGRTDAAGVSRPRWMMSCAANVLWVAYGALA